MRIDFGEIMVQCSFYSRFSCSSWLVIILLAMDKVRIGLQVCERTQTKRAEHSEYRNAPNYNASFAISLVRVLVSEGVGNDTTSTERRHPCILSILEQCKNMHVIYSSRAMHFIFVNILRKFAVEDKTREKMCRLPNMVAKGWSYFFLDKLLTDYHFILLLK